LPKKIKVGSPAWVKKMAKARKAAAKERKKGGGKKKNSSRKKLEKRLADIEEWIQRKDVPDGVTHDEKIKLRDTTKKQLDCGDW
jgi:hypothetical protein